VLNSVRQDSVIWRVSLNLSMGTLTTLQHAAALELMKEDVHLLLGEVKVGLDVAVWFPFPSYDRMFLTDGR
jgi:hypothetical protein